MGEIDDPNNNQARYGDAEQNQEDAFINVDAAIGDCLVKEGRIGEQVAAHENEPHDAYDEYDD
jgi:hypothetical protein